MDDNQPGLFDLPARERRGPANRPLRGRNRQTWARTATAEITVIDEGALREAAAQAAEGAVTILLSSDLPSSDLDVEDTEPGPFDMAPASNAIDALGWLIYPTAGMEGPLEAGAFRVLSAESKVVAESVDRGTATWRVTVKLTDIEGLRRLASAGHPDAAGLIADSLAIAWQQAADPFAPLLSIPGIAWRPGRVDVEHLPAKVAGDR